MAKTKTEIYNRISEWKKANRTRYTLQMPNEMSYDAWILCKILKDDYAEELKEYGIEQNRKNEVTMNTLTQLLLKKEIIKHEGEIAPLRKHLAEAYAIERQSKKSKTRDAKEEE